MMGEKSGFYVNWHVECQYSDWMWLGPLANHNHAWRGMQRGAWRGMQKGAWRGAQRGAERGTWKGVWRGSMEMNTERIVEGSVERSV